MEKIFQQLQHLLSIKEPAQQFPDGMEKQAMKFIAFATMSRKNENLLVVVEQRGGRAARVNLFSHLNDCIHFEFFSRRVSWI